MKNLLEVVPGLFVLALIVGQASELGKRTRFFPSFARVTTDGERFLLQSERLSIFALLLVNMGEGV